MIARIHHVLPELRISAAIFGQPIIHRAGMPPMVNTDAFSRFAEVVTPPAETLGPLRTPPGYAVTGHLSLYAQFLVPFFSRAQAFSVIIGCHTGDIHLGPGLLRQAFAVSMENSLYISSLLVSDPATALAPHNIRCIRGTTGKPGVSVMMHSSDTTQTEMMTPDTHSWQQVNHNSFQGGLEDCFSSTSLHLRFSGHEQVTNAKQSQRYAACTYVEAVVSVYAESGKWVGDINATQSLDRPLFLRTVFALDGCEGEPVGTKPERPLACIENFDELLDAPQNCPGVFKAHGNWQARLAAVSICARMGYKAILFKDHGCWKCAFKTLDRFDDPQDVRGGNGLKSWPSLGPGLQYEALTDDSIFPSYPLDPRARFSIPSSSSSESGSPDNSGLDDEADTASKDIDAEKLKHDKEESEDSEDGNNSDSSGRTTSSDGSNRFVSRPGGKRNSQFIFII